MLQNGIFFWISNKQKKTKLFLDIFTSQSEVNKLDLVEGEAAIHLSIS
jgi:hypothetical protein